MDDVVLDQARGLLPAWVGLAPIAFLPTVAFLIATLCGGVLRAILVRRATWLGLGTHWTERARLGYPVRVGMALAVIALPILSAGAASLYAGPLSAVPAWLLVGASGVAALVGATFQHRLALEALKVAPPSVAAQLRSTASMLLNLYPHIVLILAAAIFCPTEPAWAPWTVAALVTVGVVLIHRGAAFWISLRVGLARRASADLARRVDELAQRMEQPPPRDIYTLPWTAANAFAMPAAGLLAFTDRALDVLDDDELLAVAAHELGHLAESRMVVGLRVATGLAFVPLVLLKPVFLMSPAAAVGLPAITIVTILIARRVFRRMEARADEFGQRGAADRATYARALERLYEANQAPAVMPGRRIHPHLYDRLLDAGVEPSYPRPAPPPRRTQLPVALAVIAPLALFFGLRVTLGTGAAFADTPDDRLLWAAPWGGDAETLSEIARARSEEGRFEDAAILYRAAVHQVPGYVPDRAALAIVLGNAGHCEEAKEHLQIAFALSGYAPDAPPPPDEVPTLAAARRSVELCPLRSADPTSTPLTP